MSATGASFSVTIIDSASRQPVSGVTVTLYEFGASVSGDEINGTVATPLTGSSGISGVTDRYGTFTFSNLAPGLYTVVVTGAGIKPQIPSEYARVEIGPLIQGSPSYLQMNDELGVIWYLSVSVSGALVITDELV